MARNLTELLGLEAGTGDIEVRRLVVDSRQVQSGDLFVAMPGSRVDGRAFIIDACKRGAVAVLTTPGGAPVDTPVPVIEDINVRARYAQMAARFAGKAPETVVAVTGTNGKTSVADFTRQIWQGVGVEGGSLGTLGARSAPLHVDGSMTTLEPMALHQMLADFANAGVSHVALEASSHGLHQCRLDGVHLKAGAFTNLTRDHLDYHHNEQSYFDAKARLFRDLLPLDGVGVVMLGDEWSYRMVDVAEGRGLETLAIADTRLADKGHNRAQASIVIREAERYTGGQRLLVSGFGTRDWIDLPLMGGFQGHNWLTAAALAVATGSDWGAVRASAAGMVGVDGRMDLRGCTDTGSAVYVDYAHTPDGLKVVLGAARDHLSGAGKLHVVFGCGGDRDSGKRPQMGRIAAELADVVYVTDDNPRSEAAADIRAQICAGIGATGADVDAKEEGDRAKAIAWAINDLGPDDILIVAGKGHEQGQTVGDEVLPFSDLDVVDTLLGSGASFRSSDHQQGGRAS